ncbi:anti-sigma factor [Labrys sp. ZIDIC5]|uniref:anti-sigma factor n=1 Tax=Labrys sedimenti TaxID=3106036 RepID=UPI002ACA9A15|nr:anti-sigma factor [Labrys sp. ZIDIC5]MDZ5449389.1 anti-sigma factor [Labrys sp. ZIDIC5]
MTERDDLDLLAGEYVLGTLDAAERAAVAARRRREPDLDAAITAWERRLAPLTEAITPVEAPATTFPGILARLDAGADPLITTLERRLRRWRLATLGIGALAAALALFAITPRLRTPEQPGSFVAVLQKDAASPAFIVSVNVEARSLTIRPVAARPQPNKSYELWLVNDKLPGPRSLGVIGDRLFTVEKARLSNVSEQVVQQAVLAVTLEPEGGSPSGQPTGPILYSGALVQATP